MALACRNCWPTNPRRWATTKARPQPYAGVGRRQLPGRQPVVFTAQIQASPEPIRAEAVGRIERNAGGRLRMSTIEVTLHLGRKAAEMDHLQRVLDTFEEFCTVSQSIKTGVDVQVAVHDADGVKIK